MKEIIYFGVDVDDKAFHACGIFKENGKDEQVEFLTRPSAHLLGKKLRAFQEKGLEVKMCYEATYLGYSLARDMVKQGITCEVIAPSSIPRRTGKTAKTDRIDSRDLAEYYRGGLLTVIQIPDEESEQVRDLIRSRSFISEQMKCLKRHILSSCRRVGLNYREGIKSPKASYFTIRHLQWLESEVKASKSSTFQTNMKILLGQLQMYEHQLSLYADEIEKIAETPFYKKKVEALACYRGISRLSAMTFITELGDIRRFAHPRKVTSYAGLDLREYSSGGRHHRYSISKMGNPRIRTAAIEACQGTQRQIQLSRALRQRREKTHSEFTSIADRCMKRLHKKTHRMLQAGKPVNKIKTACAREMLGFIWESLNLAS